MKLADIRRLPDAFEHSDRNEIQLSTEGVDVYICTGEGTPPLVATHAPPAVAPPAPKAVAAAPEPASVAALLTVIPAHAGMTVAGGLVCGGTTSL